MELFQLEAFLAVVREGSFSAAAKALFRTQPAISQTIKKLEDEIGRPLFDRSSRRGVLTDAGRVLADHAERLVNLRTRAMAALDDVRQLRTGRLRSEEHTSELQSRNDISYAVFCLKKKKKKTSKKAKYVKTKTKKID